MNAPDYKVAIVGTRTPSIRGKEQAYKFSYELAKNDVTIVSGLARGIDTIAHQAALDAKGKTIAVLGSGKDIIYPPENKELANKIKENGEILSPFPDGTPPLGRNFLIRNELIVKLSSAVLIIEGNMPSGTLNTAKHAANLGVEVFVVPGSPVTSFLVENGAIIATKPEDILNYIKNFDT